MLDIVDNLEEEKTDWFEKFASQKYLNHQKTLSEILIENTRHLRDKNDKKDKMTKGEVLAKLLKTDQGRDILKMTE